MNTHETLLWTLAAGTFPVMSSVDYDAVLDLYGPAFGPWREVQINGFDGQPIISLAVGGRADALRALQAAGRDWQTLAHTKHPRIKPLPDAPTLADVALKAPHGLLVHRQIVRLFGPTNGEHLSGTLPLLQD